MTAPISELVAQRDAIERQIKALQSVEKAEAISQIQALMAKHGLTAADLVGKTAPRVPKDGHVSGRKVAPKYRDAASGATWSGRGLKPKWLVAALEAGRTIEEFAI